MYNYAVTSGMFSHRDIHHYHTLRPPLISAGWAYNEWPTNRREITE